MLPSSCPQNHAANLLPLPDGSLLCVWFGGTQEGIADISVWGSRLAPGSAAAGAMRCNTVGRSDALRTEPGSVPRPGQRAVAAVDRADLR